MVDRAHGTSTYQASSLHREAASKRPEKGPKKDKKPSAPLSWKRKLVYLLAALAGFAFLVVWLLLGEFRFLLGRVPALTGFPFGSRNYLVLFQNNYELRPTGGFISMYGVASFRAGIFTGIEFYDVYGEIDDHDKMDPPPILGLMFSGPDYPGYSFRDANFDPDFTYTKDELLSFYSLTNPDTEIDGVLSFDFYFLEQLIAEYDPLYVEGYEVTADNAFELLSIVSKDIDLHDEEALEGRKGISSPIVKQIIKKTFWRPWRYDDMLELAATAFHEKHLLASFERKRLQADFEERGWAGSIPTSSTGDFLAINLSNYGGMKSNRYLLQEVSYELEITEEMDIRDNPIIEATVTIDLSHEGILNMPISGYYQGYLRTMIPKGAKLIELDEDTLQEEHDKVDILGELVGLNPGESVQYQYSYQLPPYVWDSGFYYLELYKQPGTIANPYNVIVKAPAGMRLNAEGFDVREELALLQTNLRTDTHMRIELLEDQRGPIIFEQSFSGPNTITLDFNEELSPAQAENISNYELRDADEIDPTNSDTLKVLSARVDGTRIILTIDGLTEQYEERYKLSVEDLQDRFGNPIQPNPRTFTLVQRLDWPEAEPEPEVEVEPEVTPEANLEE